MPANVPESVKILVCRVLGITDDDLKKAKEASTAKPASEGSARSSSDALSRNGELKDVVDDEEKTQRAIKIIEAERDARLAVINAYTRRRIALGAIAVIAVILGILLVRVADSYATHKGYHVDMGHVLAVYGSSIASIIAIAVVAAKWLFRDKS